MPASATLDPRFSIIAELGGGSISIEANLDGDLGDRVAPEARDPRRLHEAYPAVVAASAQATPWTVIHGDAHVGNVILDGDGHPGLVDWQLVQRGGWYMDVGYHLASTLPVEVRRHHEDDLLRHYLDHLQALGVDAPSHGRGAGAPSPSGWSTATTCGPSRGTSTRRSSPRSSSASGPPSPTTRPSP